MLEFALVLVSLRSSENLSEEVTCIGFCLNLLNVAVCQVSTQDIKSVITNLYGYT